MRSLAWFKRRAAFIKTTNGRCFCGSKQHLHVHHVTYARLGHERNEDFRLVCDIHHEAIHRYHKRSGMTLQGATDEYIRKWRKRHGQGKFH